MKKTKLFTTLAALALVLGLGACDGGSSDEPTDSGADTTTDEETETTPSTSTPTDDGGNNGEGGEDIDGYTIVFTLYDTTGAVQTAPSYGSLYFEGAPTGTWNESGWWNWGGFSLLKETTNEKGEVAYSCTFDLETLNTGSDLEYMIVFTYEGEDPTWTPVKSGDNFKITIPDNATIGDVQYVECTACYTLADQYPEKVGDTNFYILYLGGTSTSTLSGSHTIQSGGSPFNGANSSETTYATTGSGKECLYNTVVGTYSAPATDYFYIYESTEGGLDISTNTITIVANTTGYAVYVCDVSANTKPSYNASWWHTNVTSIETLIASL